EQTVPAAGSVSLLRSSSSPACAHALASYEVWPLPSRVTSTEPGICLCTDCASAYGVAGSLVPPTRSIGAAPLTVRGSFVCFAFTGQKAHCRLEYWLHGPKKGAAWANLGPRAS